MATRTTSGAAPKAKDGEETRELVVNGEPVMTRAPTLEALLEESGYGGRRVATAVNGGFVPATRRGATVLARGDRIEIVSARQGG